MPDGGLHRPGISGTWHPTAALVIEMLSAGDDTYRKLDFYARHDVDEVSILDPDARAVQWLALGADRRYAGVDRSGLIVSAPTRCAGRWTGPSLRRTERVERGAAPAPT